MSHRLIRGTAPRDPSGWRLPAPELEVKVAGLIRRHMMRPEFRAGILCDATTEETAKLGDKLAFPEDKGSSATNDMRDALLNLVERIDIAPGEIQMSVSAEHLADHTVWA